MNPEKNKILFIMQLPPPVHGASMMNRFIKDSEKINNKFETSYLPLSFVKSIDEIGKLSIAKFFMMISFMFKLAQRLIVFKPKIVYYTIAPLGSAFYRDSVFLTIIKCLHRGKIIFHLHGKGVATEMASSKFKMRLYNRVFKNIDVIHLSQSLKGDLHHIKAKFNFHVIPNGIDFQDLVETKIIEKSDKIELLYLSNLIETKGVLILLNAFSKIVKKGYSNVNLKFIGNTSNSITLDVFNKKVKALNIENHVEYLGPKYDVEKTNHMLEADVFVFPTYKDCFPLAILEAMQCGLAIVTTNEGAIPEIIEHGVTGLVCERKNENDLVEQLEFLLVNPTKIKEFGDNSKADFLKKYTLEIFESNIIETFDQIIQEDVRR